MHSEKVGAFRANRTEKVGTFRANKTGGGGGGGGLYRGTYPYCFNMGVPPPGINRAALSLPRKSGSYQTSHT